MAVSFLMAKWQPLILRYIGSAKGAICSNSISPPGKQPISSSFKGILMDDTSTITPFSPNFRSAAVNSPYLD